MTATATSDVLNLPRTQWESHPNYPRQALLLGSHQGFRRFSRSLIDLVDDDGDLDTVGRLFRYWKSAMSGHEHYEEGKLYPYLEARWELSCDQLRDGHQELAELELRVGAAVEANDRARVKTALEEHDHSLSRHLDIEEELVIPALLALEPSEFDGYYQGHIDSLLAELKAS